MNVLIKRPGEPAKMTEIENTLESLQAAVGGWIQRVPTGELNIICNEEGLLQGLPYNTKIGCVLYVGTILVAGTAGEDFCGIDEETAVNWCRKYGLLYES